MYCAIRRHLQRRLWHQPLPFILLILVTTMSIILAERRTYIIHTDDTRVRILKGQSQTRYEGILGSIKKTTAHESEDDEEALAPELLYTYETTMTGFLLLNSPINNIVL